MRPIIKVWPLPEMSENQLQGLLGTIVSVCQSMPHLHVEGEADVLVGFPKDMMLKGTGEEVVVEAVLPDDCQNYSVNAKICVAVREYLTLLGFKPQLTGVRYQAIVEHIKL